VLVEDVGLGLNDAVTPAGRSVAFSVTFWAKPSIGTIVIVLLPLLPRAIIKGLGDAIRLKVPNAFTVSCSVVVAVRPSCVPVIVIVNVPSVAAVLSVRVNRLLVTAGFGLNEAVTPLGKPETERFTRPGCGLMMICVEPELPCTMLSEFGEGIRVRPGFTLRLIVVVCVRLPDVPVIVIVLVPTAAVAPTVSVIALVVVAGFVPNAAVTPFGNPEADKVTLPVNPFSGVIVIVLFPEAS
jgi:hypothetical protein